MFWGSFDTGIVTEDVRPLEDCVSKLILPKSQNLHWDSCRLVTQAILMIVYQEEIPAGTQPSSPTPVVASPFDKVPR